MKILYWNNQCTPNNQSIPRSESINWNNTQI